MNDGPHSKPGDVSASNEQPSALNRTAGQSDNQRGPAIWKIAAVVLGLGFIFTGGVLIGERLGKPGHAEDSGIGENSDQAKGSKSQAVVAALPSAIADIAAEAAPSVVTIELTPVAPKDKHQFQPNFFGNNFGGNSPNGSNGNPGNANEALEVLGPPPRKSLGTGIIMRADGYILTSSHVIRPNTTIAVGLNDKRRLPAEVVGRDFFSDLAVLKIDAKDLPVAKFGTIKNLRPGDWAIAIGSPLGFDHTVTLGIISAIGRSIDDEAFHNRVDLIQTDAAINFGNSGGPLLNIKGEVVGINTAIRGDAQNISFAIPVDEARKVAVELIAHGEIPRPYLGIYMAELTPYLASRSGLPTDMTGVLVTQVVPGGPCDKAGLGRGDVIQKVEGKSVLTAPDVRKLTRDKKPGDEFDVEFTRKGSTQTRKVVVGKYPTNIGPAH